MPSAPDAPRRDGTPTGRPARPGRRIAVGPDFVAPLTVGCPEWQRRHAHRAAAVYAGVAGSVAVLLLRGHAALPSLAVGLLAWGVGRAALRGWLHHLRRRGRAISTLLAVGRPDELAVLVARTRADPGLGRRVTGVCTSTGAGPGGAPDVAGVPVVGDLDAVAATALRGRYDAVSVGPAAGWTAVRLQQLAGALDGSRTALLVDPRTVARTGPRVRVTGVDGLPLLRLDHPTLAGPRGLVKGALDRAAALVALLLVAPLLVSCAVAARRDGGPALQRRACPGRGGREFRRLTFRTVDATGELTPVGRVLRRHRLEGLPQLLNVLGGSMALVGPRPGATISPLLKPGLTGLEPAGEPGEPALRYVDHWTPTRDARILLRTLGAALRA